MGRIILPFILFLPVLLAYNNCSPSKGFEDQSSLSSSYFVGDSNSERFKSRFTYDHFKSQYNCGEDSDRPSYRISVDFPQSQALFLESACQKSLPHAIDFNAVETNRYNAHVVRFDDLIYVNRELHSDIDQPFYYKRFCFDVEKQMDFTMQYLMDSSGHVTDWVGLMMYGPRHPLPGVQFNGGFLVELDGDAELFITDNEDYQIRFSSNQALLTMRSGETFSLQCWQSSPNP